MMKSPSGRALWLLGAALIAAGAPASSGCITILGDFSDEGATSGSSASGAPSSSSSGAGGASVAASGVGGGDASSSSGEGGSAGGGGSANVDCPSDRGPSMVLIPGPGGKDYCIDSTEVTVAQYNAWLTTEAEPGKDQPDYCVPWNMEHAPKKGGNCDSFDLPTLASSEPSRPVACINWCDAYAYCGWAGKRLCGKIGGGADDYGNPSISESSQWYRACSAGGTRAYPYGTDYDGARCVGNDYDGNKDYDVATDHALGVATANCEGGYPGLHDMSGNIFEWEDGCEAYTDEKDHCIVRGGSYKADAQALRCEKISASERAATLNDRGFRCCRDK